MAIDLSQMIFTCVSVQNLTRLLLLYQAMFKENKYDLFIGFVQGLTQIF